jgi:DNA-binding beta-propeller fold protein YncE
VIERRQHPWGIELAGFGRPFGLALDAARRLYVTDMDRHRIFRFDAGLSAHQVLGGEGLWNGPHSLDFADDGTGIVTCYYGPGIYVLGEERPLQLERAVTGPASAFFDGSGRFVVAEYSQNAVLAFDRDGRLVCEFRGRFDRPHMARALPDGSVLVADTWNNKLQRFDGSGALRDAAVAAVHAPVAIDIDAERGWLVTAWGDNAVLRFHGDGRPAGRLEAPPLEKPYDARWLDGNRVAVADSHHSRVLILDAPTFH